MKNLKSLLIITFCNIICLSTYAQIIPGATYSIKIKSNGKFLDVAASSKSNGASVIPYSQTGNENQQFTFKDAGNGYYTIFAKHSGKALDVSNPKEGSVIHQYEFHGRDNQLFKLIPKENGYYAIQSKQTNKVWDVTAAGKLVHWSLHGRGNQLFKLILSATTNNTAVTNTSGSLSTFNALDKDGKVVLAYQYKNKEDENNFSTECSLPEWAPEYDFTTTSRKYLDIFDPACAEHDRNYRAPWKIAGFKAYTGKEIADERWYEDMLTICEDRYKDDFAERQYCKTVAKSWFTVVHKVSQAKDAFDSGQQYAEKYHNKNSVQTGGIIYINSKGSYVAYMKVNYILNGSRVKKERTLEPGTSDEISIPLGASDINLHVYGTLHAEDLDFKKNYSLPVQKCFEISGKYSFTGYDASWKDTSCN